MPKSCIVLNCKHLVFAKSFCVIHQYLRTDKKKKPPKKQTPLKRTRIRPVAKKRAKQTRLYLKERAKLLGDGKPCYAFVIGHPIVGCTGEATDFNHGQGKENERLLDFENGNWLCRVCHKYYTEHSKLGIELGILKSKHNK